MTCPFETLQVGELGVTDTNVTLKASVSVSVRPLAAYAFGFVTVSV